MLFCNIIGGERRGSEKNHQVVDPRTEEPLWDVPLATASDLQDAVDSARKAFPSWSQTTWAERQVIIVRLADMIEQNDKELQDILIKETGKSAFMAGFETTTTVKQLKFYCK